MAHSIPTTEKHNRLSAEVQFFFNSPATTRALRRCAGLPEKPKDQLYVAVHVLGLICSHRQQLDSPPVGRRLVFKRIALELGISNDTVKRVMHSLRDAGLLREDREHNGVTASWSLGPTFASSAWQKAVDEADAEIKALLAGELGRRPPAGLGGADQGAAQHRDSSATDQGAAQHCDQGAAQHCDQGAAQHCDQGAAQHPLETSLRDTVRESRDRDSLSSLMPCSGHPSAELAEQPTAEQPQAKDSQSLLAVAIDQWSQTQREWPEIQRSMQRAKGEEKLRQRKKQKIREFYRKAELEYWRSVEKPELVEGCLVVDGIHGERCIEHIGTLETFGRTLAIEAIAYVNTRDIDSDEQESVYCLGYTHEEISNMTNEQEHEVLSRAISWCEHHLHYAEQYAMDQVAKEFGIEWQSLLDDPSPGLNVCSDELGANADGSLEISQRDAGSVDACDPVAHVAPDPAQSCNTINGLSNPLGLSDNASVLINGSEPATVLAYDWEEDVYTVQSQASDCPEHCRPDQLVVAPDEPSSPSPRSAACLVPIESLLGLSSQRMNCMTSSQP